MKKSECEDIIVSHCEPIFCFLCFSDPIEKMNLNQGDKKNFFQWSKYSREFEMR